ncbi:hypothetical protein [Bradyrhizobium sp. RDI18]|uniref:hypothetical protein n=1 Tax=Bradyrhizobium sp. RDI18 TaxID=3367400 RepID=UPI00371BDF09
MGQLSGHGKTERGGDLLDRAILDEGRRVIKQPEGAATRLVNKCPVPLQRSDPLGPSRSIRGTAAGNGRAT